MDSTEIDFLTGPVTATPRLERESSLVFVAFRLTWAERIVDLAMNTRFGEEWEACFTHWEIDDRRVHLCDVSRGYTVDLRDGNAVFIVSRPTEMLALAESHIVEYSQSLIGGDRSKAQIFCEAKYLTPLERDFSVEVRAMADRLVKKDVITSLAEDVVDFAYNVDFIQEGQRFQVHAGVLSKEEVPGRVESAARFLKPIPAVSRYHSVMSKVPINPQFSYSAFLDRIFRVGDTIARELSA